MKEQTFLRNGRWIPLSQLKNINNKKTSKSSLNKKDDKEEEKK